MNDPLLTDHPEEGDLSLDPSARPERSRTFTPGLDHKAAPTTPFRRLVSRESGPKEDLASLEAAPAEAPPPASWDTTNPANIAGIRAQSLPALQRNKTFDFLESVQQQTDPAALENRVSTFLRYSAMALLIGIVLTVLGSIFRFRAKPTPTAVPAAPTARAPVSEEVIDAQAAATEAIDTLRAFLASTTVAERQKLIGVDEPMPPCLSAPTRVPALEKSNFSAEDARTMRFGRQVAVLIPMRDQSGIARTAALLGGDGQYRVDWRSVMTPESMAWNDFVAAPVDEPRLFRVELTAGRDPAQPGATLSALRPAGKPATVTLSVEPRSRLGQELRTALGQRGGKSLPADVYLQGKPGGPLRIVGWTPDKWAL